MAANSYSRRCRTCNRWISMRRMLHGQWVPFEHNEPHKCEQAPTIRPRPPTSPPPRDREPVNGPTEFPDIEIPEDIAPKLPPFKPDMDVGRNRRAGPISPPAERPKAPTAPPPSPKDPAPILEPAPVRLPQSTRNAPEHVSIDNVPSVASRRPLMSRLSGGFSAALTVLSTLYVIIGALHSIAFSLLVSRMTCATTTKTIVWIFCNSGQGIAHLVTVIAWPWYWL